MKLHIPGLAEYPHCKAQFELAERLLERPDENKPELSGILKTLDDNPDVVRFLEAEFRDRYRQVYDRLTKISSPSAAPLVSSFRDSIKLENITCIDADGYEFEKYSGLYVNPNVKQSVDGNIISLKNDYLDLCASYCNLNNYNRVRGVSLVAPAGRALKRRHEK